MASLARFYNLFCDSNIEVVCQEKSGKIIGHFVFLRKLQRILSPCRRLRHTEGGLLTTCRKTTPSADERQAKYALPFQ
jgi:hypothetical protein